MQGADYAALDNTDWRWLALCACAKPNTPNANSRRRVQLQVLSLQQAGGAGGNQGKAH